MTHFHFTEELRLSSNIINEWCDYCRRSLNDSLERKQTWQSLLAMTKTIWDEPFNQNLPGPFLKIRTLARQYRIPPFYACEYLEGLRMEIDNKYYVTLKELELYCYRKSATLSLMLAHVMGVYSEKTLSHACSLGMAIQMTKIAQDVMQDKKAGKIFLPGSWLFDAGINESNFTQPSKQAELFSVVKRLIFVSDYFYQEAGKGLGLLPKRQAAGVVFGLSYYREIGQEILRQKEKAFQEPVSISPWRKMVLGVKAFWLTLFMVRPLVKNSTPINVVWKPILIGQNYQ